MPTIRHSIYDFRVTYLYFCSILWRASVTGINYFRKADLNNGMNERLRKVIYHKTLSIDNVYLIHNMLKIHLFRVVDTFEDNLQSVIDKAHLTFSKEINQDEKLALYFYLINGYLVVYIFAPHEFMGFVPPINVLGQLMDCKTHKIPKIDLSDVKQISEAFNITAEKRNRMGLCL